MKDDFDHLAVFSLDSGSTIASYLIINLTTKFFHSETHPLQWRYIMLKKILCDVNFILQLSN